MTQFPFYKTRYIYEMFRPSLFRVQCARYKIEVKDRKKLFKIVENSQLHSQYCVSTLCGKRAITVPESDAFSATLLLKIYEKLNSVRKKV